MITEEKKKPILKYSYDADYVIYTDKSISVNNYDSEVYFNKSQKVQGTAHIDEEGNIMFIPNGTGNARPRSQVVCDNGAARIKVSPQHKTVKLEIVLPMEVANHRTFTFHGRDILKQFTKWKNENL